jgi:hypothetical protein
MERIFPIGWEAVVYGTAAIVCVSLICSVIRDCCRDFVSDLARWREEVRAWRHFLGKKR